MGVCVCFGVDGAVHCRVHNYIVVHVLLGLWPWPGCLRSCRGVHAAHMECRQYYNDLKAVMKDHNNFVA